MGRGAALGVRAVVVEGTSATGAALGGKDNDDDVLIELKNVHKRFGTKAGGVSDNDNSVSNAQQSTLLISAWMLIQTRGLD